MMYTYWLISSTKGCLEIVAVVLLLYLDNCVIYLDSLEFTDSYNNVNAYLTLLAQTSYAFGPAPMWPYTVNITNFNEQKFS